MEQILSCDICCQKYNSKILIPRVLNCGHSFCTTCIKKLENSICPKCRTTILCEENFPINYSLLSLIGECNTTESLNPKDNLPCIQNLRERLNIMLLDVEKEISERTVIKNSIENNLEILQSIEDDSLQEVCVTRERLNEVKKRCEHLSLPLSAASPSNADDLKASNFSLENSQRDDNLNDARETPIRRNEQLSLPAFATSLANFNDLETSNFSLKNSKTPDAFLQEIYSALRNSEKVFTFKCTDEKLRFGQLFISNKELFIYSLTLDEVPKGSKTVPFEDLEAATKAKNLYTFIELKENQGVSLKIVIKLVDNSRCSNFIKLCTGEYGPSYKGCLYSSGGQRSEKCQGRRSVITRASHYYASHNYAFHKLQRSRTYNNVSNVIPELNMPIVLKVDVSNGLSEENFNNLDKTLWTPCYSNEVVLIKRPSEGFQLLYVEKSENAYEYQIMGKVVNLHNIGKHVYFDHSLSISKIWDCGIATDL